MKRFPIASVALLGLAALVGCGSKPESTTTAATPVKNDVDSLLAQADKADGAEDHTIGKCYVCSLGMDGSSEFAAKYKDYTAHLCSEACKKEFEEKAEKIVMDTPIPKSKGN